MNTTTHTRTGTARPAPRTDRVVEAIAEATGRLVAVVPVLAVVAVLGLRVLDRGRARLRAEDPERGASVVEWVLILAVVITIVAVVAVIVRNKLIAKSNELDLSTP